jgi:membrane-bound lytic murein transglycosylase D
LRSSLVVLIAATMTAGCATLTAPTPEPVSVHATSAPAASTVTPTPPADAAPADDEATAAAAGEAPPSDLAPEPPATLMGALRADFRLAHAEDERRVEQQIDWFRRHPEYLARLQPRIEQYLPYICAQVREREMPAELCLLPIIESALDPFAFSPGGAAGLWQFIPGTAKRYGLKIDWWVDERRDPVASTDSALDYLQALHERFDDWSLAVAAYNCGEGRVARALLRADDGADFFDLKLPRETAAYVPRLLAFAAIIDEPAAHGIELPFEQIAAQAQHTAAVQTGGQIDIARAADAVGISVEQVYALNPALNQWATHPNGPDRLIVPADMAEAAQQALDELDPQERVAWIRHEIRPNQTLGGLAVAYDTDVATLKRVNGLDGTRIRAGDHLMIPKSSLAAGAYPTPGRARASSGSVYVVQSGDSLWTISRRFGVSTKTLMRTNHIGPKDLLQVGQQIIVPQDGALPGRESTVRTVRYRVRSGDSLARISSKFNVSVSQIAAWNDIDPKALIHPGQSLVLHVDVVATRT